MQVMQEIIKCRQCRTVILDSTAYRTSVVNSHNLPLVASSDNCSPTLNELVYLNEELLPEWIVEKIQEANWSKGRLYCNNCGVRIGGFNFISGAQCQCDAADVLPPVYLIKSKLDFAKT